MKSNYELLINQFLSRLKESGFSERRFADYQKVTLLFLKLYNNGDVSSLEDFHDYLYRTIKDAITLWKKIAIITKLRNFELNGSLPTAHIRNRYVLLPANYQAIVDEALEIAQKQGKASKSLENLKHDGTSFLYHLSSLNKNFLDAVTVSDVESYFYSDGQTKRGYYCRKGINWFFKILYEATGKDIYRKIMEFIPKVVNMRKIYPSLTQEEAVRLENAILDNNNSLSWFDRAIGALAFYAGIRSVDISNLESKNLDWKNNIIRFVQSKTNREISLKLDPVIGNPIYEYIVNERPKEKTQLLFLRKKSKKQIDRHDVYKAIYRIFVLSGVRVIEGRRGAHLLRHHLATQMVSNDTDISIVSSALGHVVPKSTDTYLEADTKRLKKCAISIDNVMPQIPDGPYVAFVFQTFLNLLSLNPNLIFPNHEIEEYKSLGLVVSDTTLLLKEDKLYGKLKSLSINNEIIKTTWKH